MKYILLCSLLILSAGCRQSVDKQQQMQSEIDSLQKKLSDAYTPGLGEFMSGIQVHHTKLWFAGINGNWKLADFEINEIKETLDDIRKYNTDRPEVKSIGMIDPVIDSISTAIKQQNPSLFRSSYVLLTNTCNNCHRATAHEFNVIIVPASHSFADQEFKPLQ